MKKSVILMGATALAIAVAAVAGQASPRGERAALNFADMDVDGDGRLTAADLEAFRADRFARIDSDGDGAVTLEEFSARASADAAERAGRMFERLDADADGRLGRDVLERRGRGPDPRMIERFDTDGDGALSEDEFDAIRARMAEHRGSRGQ